MKLVMETEKNVYFLIYEDNIKMGLKKTEWECVDWGQDMTLATHYSKVSSLQMYRTIPQLPHVPVFHR
jgi:hypothetical protein